MANELYIVKGRTYAPLTDEDVDIFYRWPVKVQARLLRADKRDAELMRLRTRSASMGIKPIVNWGVNTNEIIVEQVRERMRAQEISNG